MRVRLLAISAWNTLGSVLKIISYFKCHVNYGFEPKHKYVIVRASNVLFYLNPILCPTHKSSAKASTVGEHFLIFSQTCQEL